MASGDPVRRLAWQVLQQVDQSRVFADSLLDRSFSSRPALSLRDRGFVTETVMGVLRWRSRLDRAIHNAAKNPRRKVDARLLQLLRLGTYQILFMDRVPDAAAVNECVGLARTLFKDEKIAKFVNALLRQVARRKGAEELPPLALFPVDHIAKSTAHPEWMVKRWVREFGPEKTLRYCQSNNARPPLTIRVNTCRISRPQLQERLNHLGIEATPTLFSPEGLVLASTPMFGNEGLFAQGMFFIQDEASQIIAHLLAPQRGEKILDACAAPGGKTTHLAQRMNDQGIIIALDQYPSKIRRIQENCRRMGISIVHPFQGDALQPLPFLLRTQFDRILVDAPCSALGLLHRNPEIKWRRVPEDLRRLQKLQLTILEQTASYLKVGGILVYSTCTLSSEENDEVVKIFLGRHPEFDQEDLREVGSQDLSPLLDEKGFFRTYPDMNLRDPNYRMDGFFAARLKKMSPP